MQVSRWEELAPGVFRRRFAAYSLNVGLVTGETEALLVDTRCTEAEGRALRAEAEAVAGVEVRQVVNTHAHFDHCFGNAAFAGARLWGHRGCAADLRRDGERQRQATLAALGGSTQPLVNIADLAATPIVAPTELVGTRATLHVDERPVHLLHVGRGHTDHDLVVAVPDAGVLFAGDLVEESGPPAFEDSWPLEWPATVAGLLEHVGGPAGGQVVPGHGEVVGQEFVRGQQAELAAVADLAVRVAAGDLDLAAALAASPYPETFTRTALARAAATA